MRTPELRTIRDYPTRLQLDGNSCSKCGYCTSRQYAQVDSDPNRPVNRCKNFGFTAHSFTTEIFGRFLEIGWVRSGRYLYKPVMEETCCPQYTIRLNVHDFQLSRTQKRVLRNMLEFLKYDKRPSMGVGESEFIRPRPALPPPPQRPASADNPSRDTGDGAEHQSGTSSPSSGSSKNKQDFTSKKTKIHTSKYIRVQRLKARFAQRGIDFNEYRKKRAERELARRRTLESFLNYEYDEQWQHRLEIRLVSILSAEFRANFEESYQLFLRYQRTIHVESDPSRDGYRTFLCISPFVPDVDGPQQAQPQSSSSSSPMESDDIPFFGAYHQQYLLDGRLIAVGVLDILPHCISSKYFYYDPDYKFLSMGTYSALREIHFTKTLSRTRPELCYYYMGYYIYDCPKMRYKGRFRPSYLLCEKTRQWFPLVDCERMLAANDGRFTVFGENRRGPTALNITDDPRVANLARRLYIYVNNRVINFGDFLSSHHLTVYGYAAIRALRIFAYYTEPLIEERREMLIILDENIALE